MLDKEIQFFSHSGTGNTHIAVQQMLEVFRDAGFRVHHLCISPDSVRHLDPSMTIGLAFPVAFQSSFPFIWDFFKSLPEVNGTQVFMVDTLMGFSGAVVGPLKKLLTSKGYVCIGKKEIRMPNNYFPRIIDREKNERILRAGMRTAREYAQNLIQGRTYWRRIPLIPDVLHALLLSPFVLNTINLAPAKNIMVDPARCIQCGLCVTLCPTGNILMDDFPQISDNCQLCMRCINFCPTAAIQIPGRDIQRYRAVSAREVTNCE